MRFVFHSVATSFGGGESYLLSAVSGLRERGFEAVVVLDSNSPPAELLDLCSPQFKHHHEDVILLNGIGSLYRWAGKLPACKRLMYVQHSLVEDGQSSLIKRMLRPVLLRWLLKKVDKVVRVCDAALPDRFHGGISTVYNGVPLRASKAVDRDISLPFRLVMVGSVNANKNQQQIIKLLPLLGSDVHLRVVGDGPSVLPLRKLASELGVEHQIEWLGFRKDAIRCLSDCHALLILSKYEALPFAALEGMSVGLPVLSSAVGGMPELVKAGYNGYLFDYGDDAQLLTALNELKGDEKLRLDLGTNGLQTIANGFSREAMLDGLIHASLN